MHGNHRSRIDSTTFSELFSTMEKISEKKVFWWTPLNSLEKTENTNSGFYLDKEIDLRDIDNRDSVLIAQGS